MSTWLTSDNLAARFRAVRRATLDQEPVAGLTHTFYW